MLLEKFNLAKQTDSYKCSHWLQFPPNTKRLYYYIESRSKDEEVLFFGLQAIIKEYFTKIPDLIDIEEAALFWQEHGFSGIFNYDGWKKIVDLGYLPVEIYAVEEGKLYPSQVPLVTVVNTIDEFYWIPGWIETLLMQVWYPITVATKSYKMKQVILKYLEKTGNPDDIGFKLHDFGFRGCTSWQQAAIGGMAHAVNFLGSDTVAANDAIMNIIIYLMMKKFMFIQFPHVMMKKQKF